MLSGSCKCPQRTSRPSCLELSTQSRYGSEGRPTIRIMGERKQAVSESRWDEVPRWRRSPAISTHVVQRTLILPGVYSLRPLGDGVFHIRHVLHAIGFVAPTLAAWLPVSGPVVSGSLAWSRWTSMDGRTAVPLACQSQLLSAIGDWRSSCPLQPSAGAQDPSPPAFQDGIPQKLLHLRSCSTSLLLQAACPDAPSVPALCLTGC